MAQKRMFDKTITNADDFLDMPLSSQILYFHLSMNADDDGFINNWKSIMRMTGTKDDDLKVLIAKQYIIPFDSGVVVIRHWRINNYLRSDRYIETKFKDEKSKLTLDNNLVYQVDTNGIPSIEENSIDKNSIDKNSIYTTTTNNNKSIFDLLQENGFILGDIQYDIVKEWDDSELTRYAIKQAVLNNKANIKYIQQILNSYEKENIKTVQQAIEREEEYQKKKDNYYKNKYSLKENRHDREKRVEEEFLKNDKDRSNEINK